jgi:hypothetical protein
VLKDAGMVRAERQGYFIHYAVAPDAAELCEAAIESTFGSKKRDKQCATEKSSARDRRS